MAHALTGLPRLAWRIAFVAALFFGLRSLYPLVQSGVDALVTTRYGVPGREFALKVMGAYVLHQVLFWAICIPAVYLDITRSPAWLFRFKLQKFVNSKEVILNCLRRVAMNQLFVLLPFVLIFSRLIDEWIDSNPDNLPSPWTAARDLMAFLIVEEVGFYFSHLALHTRFLYQHVHKVHHEFHASIAPAAEYAHPLEFLLSNVSPLFAGPILMRSHIVTWWWWTTIALLDTLHSHSGYDFPFSPTSTSVKHEYHHASDLHCNIGALGIFDRLVGSFRSPSQIKEAKRVSRKGDNSSDDADHVHSDSCSHHDHDH